MSVQLNLYIFLAIFLYLPLTAVTDDMSNCLNTSQTICAGTLPGANGFYPQYECTANLFSSVNLSSCDNGDPTMAIYWFWYDDVCNKNTTRNLFFAAVDLDNTFRCRNRSNTNITQEICENEYNFTRQTMIIKNITKSTSQKYICFLSDNQASMNYTSAKIYSINISEPTTLATTSLSTTSFSTIPSTINNTEGSTGNFSGTESTPSGSSPPLYIILPIVFGVLLIILLVIAGAFYYRRRGRRRRGTLGKRPDKYQLKPVPSITQRQAIYGDDISTLDSERSHSIWQPVQRNT